MGRKLDALLGRNFRASKFRPLLNLSLSRLSILTAQRRVGCSQANSDVLQLLQLSHHHRALLRVEKVIKDQNALDAYVLIEGYLNLLLERTTLLEQQSECPEELKEAVAGLLFAASRCGDFPELHEIKSVLTTRFGKEFTARAVELRNNCGVNLSLMQKLSTRQPTLETRMDALKSIASENGIVLQIDQLPSSKQEKVGRNGRQSEAEGQSEEFSNEVASGSKTTYKDVADAAQAAFESAAQAAAAARAAMELSRSHEGPSSPSKPGSGTTSDNKQKKEKREVESKVKQEMEEYGNGRKGEGEGEEEEGDGMDEERTSNGLKMETKVEKTEVSEKGSFRLNLEKKPISVRTRRVGGY
ncbi:uncharacterized protein LOC101211044 [Cucumis sativus]|uniref:Regulator of Vps4 activity in the MVB pathway protein n=1 Tax=Cucumis sativus TaxID=3659 RepID=A0A0A0KAU0_CUCSA|nr:uncharacterized protein LOC101211044 [Cucumis sativus]KGN45949.1 hypothetical protein Csa_005294 [Cucumis sativus]